VGGKATMAFTADTLGLDPTISWGKGTSGGTQLTAIYDTLVWYNPATSQYEPRVAESLTHNDTATEWTLTLRNGIRFGNGDPLTAQDVVDSIQRHRAKPTISAPDARLISSMRAVDDRTVVFDLTEPWGSFPYMLSSEGGMITNPRVVNSLGADFNTKAIGAGVGPYEVESYAPNERLVLKAKPDYWGGQPCITQLTFVVIPTNPVDALKTGQVQALFTQSFRDTALLKDGGYKTVSQLSNLGGMVRINVGFGSPPTSDVRLRQAVQYALDPAAIDKRVNDGKGLPTTGIVHEDSPLYSGVPTPPYDPAKARALVDEVKASTAWDGSIQLITSNAPDSVEASLTIEALLQAVGFKVSLDNSLAANDFINRMIVSHNFQLGIAGLNINTPSPATSLEKFFATGNTFNGYSNPEFDAVLKELRQAVTLDQQKTAIAKLQNIWNRDLPAAIYGASSYVVGWDKSLHGLLFNADNVVRFDKAYTS
jgi:peptide/nickel transport system substrate-binding protein